MFGIGAGEFVVILIVALIVFGPGKLPEVGRAIGKGLREFRKAQAALSQTLNSIDEPEKKSGDEKSATVTQTPVAEKILPAENNSPATEKTSPVEKSVDEKISSATEKFSPVEKSGDEKISSATEKTSPVEKSVDEKISSATEKFSPVEKSAAEKSATVEKSVAEKSVETSPPTVTTDEIIKLAKESPLVKENHHEKISDGHSVDVADNAERTSPAGARSSSNGVDKQP